MCVQDDLGCSTSFIFALRVLSRQVVADSWGGPAHPIFTGVKHSVATQKGTELGKSIQYIFSLQVKTSPMCSKDYTRLSKVCMIHFAGSKILKKPKQLNPLKWGSHRAHDVSEEMKGVSKAEQGTWVFGDDNLISFSYTAIQMMGNSLQRLDLRNPMEIHPQKKSYLGNSTRIQLRFSFKQTKNTALRRRKMTNSVLFSKIDRKSVV